MGLERYGSDYTTSTTPEDDWGTLGNDLTPAPAGQEPAGGSRLSRLGDRLSDLREGLVTSERQEMALSFARSVGTEALVGAAKDSGLLEVDRETEDVRVRPVRLAMGVLRPGRTMRRAATGAVKGARRGAIIGGAELARGAGDGQDEELVGAAEAGSHEEAQSQEPSDSYSKYR